MGSNQFDKVRARRPHLRGSRTLRSDIDDVAQQVGGGVGIRGLVELRHGLFDAVGEGHLAVRVAQCEQALEACLELGIAGGRLDDQELAGPVEGVGGPAAVPEALLLDPAADLVDRQDGVAHDVEAVDDPRRLGGHDPEHRGVGLGHVQTAVLEALFHVVGLAPQPARHRGELPGGEHVDEGVVGHVAHGGRPGLVLVGAPRARRASRRGRWPWSPSSAWCRRPRGRRHRCAPPR